MASVTNLDSTSSQLALTSPADQKPPLLSLPLEVIMNIFDQLRNSPKDCAHLEMTCREILVISRDSHSTHWNTYPQHFFALYDAFCYNPSWRLPYLDPKPVAEKAAEKALMEEEGVEALRDNFLNALLITKDMVPISAENANLDQDAKLISNFEADLIQEFYSGLRQVRNKLGFNQTDRLLHASEVAFHQIINKSIEKSIASKAPVFSQEQLAAFHKYVRETTMKESIDAFMSQPLEEITRKSFKEKRDLLAKAHFLTDTTVEMELRKAFQQHYSFDDVDDFVNILWAGRSSVSHPFLDILKKRIKQQLTDKKDRWEKELNLLRGSNGFNGKINEMYWKSVEETIPDEFYRIHSSLVHRLGELAIFDDSGAIVGGALRLIENDLDDHVIEYLARIEELELCRLLGELNRPQFDEYANWREKEHHADLEKILDNNKWWETVVS